MTASEFVYVYQELELREYVKAQARRHSRRDEDQEDYVQEAWLAISTAPGGLCVDFYKSMAYKAIYSGYWQHNRERLLQNQT